MPHPKLVMDASTAVAYHARAAYIHFPYSESQLALKYIEKKSVDFSVLREDRVPHGPCANDWVENGIPDS